MLNQRGIHIAAQYSKGSAAGRPGKGGGRKKSGNAPARSV